MDGLTIRAIRINAGLTQEEMAKKLGIRQSWLSQIECGRRPVSARVRIRTAQVFGLDDEIIRAIDRAKAAEKLAL